MPWCQDGVSVCSLWFMGNLNLGLSKSGWGGGDKENHQLCFRWGCFSFDWEFTVAVTLLLPLLKVLQLQRALRKPSTGLAQTTGGPQRGERVLFELADTPLWGSFAASAERPAAVNLEGQRWFSGQDGLFFPLLLPFRKHILLFLPSVFASGGKEVR